MAPKDDQNPDGTSGERPFPESLCWRCAGHRVVQAARSVFVKCETLPVKYPRQPVATCPAFRPLDHD